MDTSTIMTLVKEASQHTYPGLPTGHLPLPITSWLQGTARKGGCTNVIIDELIDYLASCGAEIPTVQNGDLSTMDTSTLFCNFSFPRHAEGGMFLEKKETSHWTVPSDFAITIRRICWGRWLRALKALRAEIFSAFILADAFWTLPQLWLWKSWQTHVATPKLSLPRFLSPLTSNPAHSLSRCPTPHYWFSGRHKGPFNYLAELRSCGSACATFWMSFVITLIHRPILAPLSISRLEDLVSCVLHINTKKNLENGQRYDHSCQAPRRMEQFRPAQRGCIGLANLCAKHARSQVPAHQIATTLHRPWPSALWSCSKALSTALAALWLLLLKTQGGTCQDSLDQADCHASRCWYIAPCNLEMQIRLDHCPDAIEVFQVGQWSSPRKFARSLHRWESLPFPSWWRQKFNSRKNELAAMVPESKAFLIRRSQIVSAPDLGMHASRMADIRNVSWSNRCFTVRVRPALSTTLVT